jgi:predicted RNA-binding Zn-ribbon protein involved in translation (DUF1610 family)
VAIKVFVTSNHIATFPCPKCGNSYQKDVSKFIGHETQVRLKYKCKCKNSFSVLLERRRAIRKEVNFKGFLIEKKQKIPITIVDISKHGIKIEILKSFPLKEGDRLRVEFNLDDPNSAIISKTVRINKITSPITIGCEFTDYDHFGELGKYFLFHF